RPHLVAAGEVTMHLPFEVADYVDFYSSEQHAVNAGKIFLPDAADLPPNLKHLPICYHGRAGTVVVSRTPDVRPSSLRKPRHAVRAGPRAVRVLAHQGELGPRPGHRGPAERPSGVQPAVRHAVLDRAAAARAHDRERCQPAYRRLLRFGHGHRPGS